jgi:hypothetical protein
MNANLLFPSRSAEGDSAIRREEASVPGVGNAIRGGQIAR